MMKLKTIYIHIYLLICLFLIPCIGFAQPGAQYSTTNKKAIEFIENAKTLFDRKIDDIAIKEVDKAIKEDSSFFEAYLMKASILDGIKDYTGAVPCYKKALSLNPDKFPNAYLAMAKDMMRIQKYDDAIANLNKYLAYPSIHPDLKKDAEKQLKNAAFASNAIKNPVPFNPINMGSNVNSKYMDYFPSISTDETILFFTRTIPFDTLNPKSNVQEDFFITEYKNGNWQKAYNAGKPLNTDGNDGAQTLSPDGQQLLFTACEDVAGEYPGGRKGNGRCDVFYTYKMNGQWVEPKNINRPISAENWDAQPCMASDGKTIYFISNRKGGYGGMDIWRCFIQDDNTWSAPENLGSKINTVGNEMSVFIHPDNKTLYFSSNGHIGMGEHDLFVSRLDDNNVWGEPVNLGYPINTPGDEYRLVVNAKGDKAYFSSERPGGYGKLDIYTFEMPAQFKPGAVAYFKGKVYDAATKKPLSAKFELIDLATGKTVVTSISSSTTGEFLVCLPPGKNYALSAGKDGYLFYSENFDLTNYKSQDPYVADVPMYSATPGSKVILKNIFFETAKFDLKEQSQVELKKLLKFLQTNATANIEIGGHTDNVGDKKANQLLSENRAKAVYTYLITNGIAATRLSYKGYGDTMPIDDNKTEKGKANNRRTEFTIK